MSWRTDVQGDEREGKATSARGIRGLVLGVLLLSGCLDPNEPGNLVPKTVDEDPSLPAIELNGTKLHTETFGDPASPVIIMLHGGPGADYRGMRRLHDTPVDGVRLADHHFVVYYDQRGCGLSRRHDAAEISRATYEADLLALIDKHAPGRQVVLIGHSWGAMLATDFIPRHTDRVAGAVLMDSGPLTSTYFEELKDGIQNLDIWSEWLNDTSWGQSIVTPDGHARLDYILFLGMLGDGQPGYHLPNPRSPNWRLGAVANHALQKEGMPNGKPDWDFTKGLERYPNRVLFEGAELNEVIGASLQRRQMTAYPNAELAVIQGAGHEFPWTHTEAALRPMLGYLTAIGF